MKSKIVIMVMMLTTTSFLPQGFAAGFVDDKRYRGWFFFEEKRGPKYMNDQSQKKTSAQSSNITPLEAKREIETFAKELEDLKFMMLARPTPENVRAYREKEKQMWDQADTLHNSWDMANLLFPDQRDLINNPVNVQGVKAKRAMLEEENRQKIKELAKNFDLVLFFSATCKYCQLLSPVLKNFGEQYGFNIEAISNNGSKHEYFKTTNAAELIERLGIKAFPTVIAISHDAKVAFELIRGYVSAAELEEYSLLAIKHLESLDKKEKIKSSFVSNEQITR